MDLDGKGFRSTGGLGKPSGSRGLPGSVSFRNTFSASPGTTEYAIFSKEAAAWSCLNGGKIEEYKIEEDGEDVPERDWPHNGTMSGTTP
jgi:hypothetical protein